MSGGVQETADCEGGGRTTGLLLVHATGSFITHKHKTADISSNSQ
jgi:hypothetical protein